MGLRNTLKQNAALARELGLDPLLAKYQEARGVKGPYSIMVNAGDMRHEIFVREGTDDIGVLHEIYTDGLYRIPPLILERYCNERKINFFDFGGHIGISAIVILSQLQGVVDVNYHLFEPDPESLAFSIRNLVDDKRFQGVNFNFHQLALGDFCGSGCLSSPTESFLRGEARMTSCNRLFPPSGEEGNVDVVDIPYVMDMLGGNRIDGIKIDIEGSESGLPWYMMINEASPDTVFLETHESLSPDSSETLMKAVSDARLVQDYQRGSNYSFYRE